MRILSIKNYNFKAKLARNAKSDPISGHRYESLPTLSAMFGFSSNDWMVFDCFCGTKTKDEILIDMDNETNKKNIDTLKKIGANTTSREKLLKEFSLSKKEINAWINYGFIKPIVLQGINGHERNSGIFDMSLEDNKKCIERLIQKRSQINQFLIRFSASDVYASLSQLSGLGFGSIERLEEMISKGVFKNAHRNYRNEFVIDMKNEKNQQILESIRNSRTINQDKAQETYGISNYDFLRSLYNGDVVPLEAVFIGDMSDIRIDLTQGKNKENFLKLVLTSLAQFKLTHNDKWVHNSLSLEILLNLMPEIGQNARLLADNNLIDIFKNKDDFEHKNSWIKLNSGDEGDEEQIETSENETCSVSCPTEEELKLIDEFSHNLAKNIDMKKFEKCLIQSVKYAKQYNKTKNISLIDNKTAQNAIVNYRQNYRTLEY